VKLSRKETTVDRKIWYESSSVEACTGVPGGGGGKCQDLNHQVVERSCRTEDCCGVEAEMVEEGITARKKMRSEAHLETRST
jgi:hypothetical protein